MSFVIDQSVELVNGILAVGAGYVTKGSLPSPRLGLQGRLGVIPLLLGSWNQKSFRPSCRTPLSLDGPPSRELLCSWGRIETGQIAHGTTE